MARTMQKRMSNWLDLVGDIAQDGEKLLGQQVELLRSEIGEELRLAGGAVAEIGAGAGLLSVAGLMSALMMAHGLHRASRLPLWGCYGVVGGVFGAVGAGLIASGQRRARHVRLVPDQTLEGLRENLAWLKEQAT